MNRRAFILSVFGGVAALELSGAPDLATPKHMPVATLPDPAKWQVHYSYAFFAEMSGTEWGPLQLLSIRRDFYLTRISWNAPDGAVAELYGGKQLLCRAMLNRIQSHQCRLTTALLMDAGEEFVLKLKNASGSLGTHKAALLLEGFQLMSDSEIAEKAREAREIGQSVGEDEDDSDEGVWER